MSIRMNLMERVIRKVQSSQISEAQFINPGVIKDVEVLNDKELARAIRMSISAEQEAIHLYEVYAEACKDNYPEISKVFQDIADEEKVHVGEFEAVLSRVDADDVAKRREGEKEVEEL